MKRNEPDYQLENTGDAGWRFVHSAEMEAATEKFDEILDSGGGRRGLTVALREFINKYANHIDGLFHYAMCKMQDGKPLDGYAFAHAAVAVGRAAFPPGFRLENDCLQGGWIENRPFLRALHGLMLAQRAVFLRAEAIATGYELLGCDSGDRFGVRMVLPVYLLEEGRETAALELFERPEYQGAFGPIEFLHPLTLIRLGRAEEELAPVWKRCFERYPKTANYLLNRSLPKPEPDSPFGIIVGGDYEAWEAAAEQRWLWEKKEGAIESMARAKEKYS